MGWASLNALLDAQSYQDGSLWVGLITIQHPLMVTPLRLVNRTNVNLVSNGNTFIATNFDLVLGSDRFEDPVRAELRVDHVDGIVLTALQGLRPAPDVTIQIVRPEEANIVLVSAPDLEASTIIVESISSMTIQLTLGRFFSLPFPGVNMNRKRVAGIFTDL